MERDKCDKHFYIFNGLRNLKSIPVLKDVWDVTIFLKTEICWGVEKVQ